MNPILNKVESFLEDCNTLKSVTVEKVRYNPGHNVDTYSELVGKLAQLAFSNPEWVLLFRGQNDDYKEKAKTTLFPSMYRSAKDETRIYNHELRQRYEELMRHEQSLKEVLRGTAYWDRVGRSELARWAILQHYEVCPTPLLDVTHSALVACSFAFLNPPRGRRKHFYLYVLGVPQISGAVTVSSSQAVQVVRLSSVCPPETLRPYFQEGYLLGTYPSVDTFDEKISYERCEMDCAQRLVAKFKISTSDRFWDSGFHPLPASAVYPNEANRLCHALAQLKHR